MNKHGCLLDMLMNKILFILGRCNYNDNNSSSLKDLAFVPLTVSKTNTLSLFLILSVILKRSPPPTVENDITLLFENFIKSAIDSKTSEQDISILTNKRLLSRRYRLISTSRIIKKRRITEPKLLDIAKIEAVLFYHLARFKENKLFSLTINEIYIFLKNLLRY